LFEVNGGEGIGSIAGGGRYDGMIGIFSGKQIPAVGISLGIERIMEIIKSKVCCVAAGPRYLSQPQKTRSGTTS
jgi:histidyl-tRNA synthetase